MQELINVATLPEATMFLNYPSQGPAIGSYLGPNDLGEYLTVVSREAQCTCGDTKATYEGPQRDCPEHGEATVRIGLRHGVYTIDGEAAGPTPIPPEVLLASWTIAERVELAAWQPIKTAPLRGVNRLVLPTHEIHDSRFVAKGID